jgi:ADP-heptose:LPS heptosyltransferase
MDIEIILPNRIGDAILSLPALVCLKQLQEKFPDKTKNIVLYPPLVLHDLIDSLNIFETRKLDRLSKIGTWLHPAEKTFMLDSSSRYLGMRIQKSYGEVISNKWTARYNVNLPFLGLHRAEDELPEDFINYFRDKFAFSLATTRYFGIIENIGWSFEEIKTNFVFDENSLSIGKSYLNERLNNLPENYCVICMEAAYGRKREAKRRWDEDKFTATAKILYEEFHLPSVFIGLDNKSTLSLPQEYFHDLRGKQSLHQLCRLLKFAKAYVGNDTGPLHLANLLTIPSVAIYLSTNPKEYGPIFGNLNFPAINPQEAMDLKPILAKISSQFSRMK